MYALRSVVLVLAVWLSATAAHATPGLRLVYRSLDAVRANPLGIQSENRLSLRLPLYASDRRTLRDNFAGLTVAPVLTAASLRLGVGLELQPASFLQLFASWEALAFFGHSFVTQSFPSATSAYDDTTRRTLAALPDGDPRGPPSMHGNQLNFGAILSMAAGPMLVRGQGRLMRATLSLRPGDRTYYDATSDLLVGNGGWFATGDLDAWWRGERLTMGLRWSLGHAFYEDRHFAPEDDRSLAPGTLQRLGPMLTYAFAHEGSRFEPSLVALVQWWIANPVRFSVNPQAVPMVALGAVFSGDLFSE